MKVVKSGNKISERDIEKLQKEIEFIFPKDYSDFLIQNNGGETEEDMLFDFFDEALETENTTVIREFYSINGKTMDIITAYNNLMNEDLIPKEMIPIADDPGGNVIGISLNKSEYGTVYYLSSEYEEINTGHLLKSKIAASFSEFLNRLYIDEE